MSINSRIELLIAQTYNGDGQAAKRFERETFTNAPVQTETVYYLRSTVLGSKLLAEITPNGTKTLANHPWSLANMWTNTANSRLNDSNTSGRERLMWGNVRDSEQFWQNLANGFITIPEYITRGREIISTGSREHRLSAGTDYNKLEAAVDKCAQQIFKVKLLNPIDWSSKGHSGQMDFKADGAQIRDRTKWLGLTYPLISTFSVYNNATSYSASQLGSIGKGGFGWSSGFYQTYAKELGKNVYTNQTFTANNVDDPNTDPLTPNGAWKLISFFESIQIHETGNALARLTGIIKKAGNWTDPKTGKTYHFGVKGVEDAKNEYRVDTDTGQAFELCVMVEYRQSMGF